MATVMHRKQLIPLKTLNGKGENQQSKLHFKMLEKEKSSQKSMQE